MEVPDIGSFFRVNGSFLSQGAFLTHTFREGTAMRRIRVCSACGKPTTIASASCLWCGQKKRFFSGRIFAGVKTCLSFLAALLFARWSPQLITAKPDHEQPQKQLE
jgi:hypothetical protein